VYRSDDGGASWANLTAYRQQSIIGSGMRDLAVSPRDRDELVVGNEFGVWRSLDGGASWTGLNDALPNLPARRLVGLPHGTRGLRVAADGMGVIEWAPGEKQAWKLARDPDWAQQALTRAALSRLLGAEITALAAGGETAYAGAADGRLFVSADRGQHWQASAKPPGGGPVERLFADPRDGRLALAALAGDSPASPRVLRTVNAGLFWDDLTSDLPSGRAYAVAADRAAGAVYVATERGVFYTRADLNAAGPPTKWTAVQGLPDAPALDVGLDSEGNQLFVAVEGYGIHAAIAPHRTEVLRIVSAADLVQRPAAPGALLSLLGGKVRTARAEGLNFPVLAASDTESQIQVPFDIQGPGLALALDAGDRSFLVGVPLLNVAPAIFVDRDGTPLLLNADTGILLDAMNPAHSNSRIQILATGLGKVRPNWPAGIPGPAENPPQVVAPVRAYLDRIPVEVTRATLAPGYVGLYLVEVQLPALVNAGPAELYVEADARQSNRVRVYIEP
jgi:uncharacterized protein (TIGR03437 family)